jgi:DNA-binding CsgD family transcriptional regulator
MVRRRTLCNMSRRKKKRTNPKKWVPRLSPEESEKKVIDLYKAGAPMQKIASEAHKSPNLATEIIKRHEKWMFPRSETKRSAALKLLKQGCKAEELAVRLDLSPDEVEQYKTELMTLRGIDDYGRIYFEIRDKIQDLSSFYNLCKAKGIDLDQIPDLKALVKNQESIRLINDSLQERVQQLQQDINHKVTLIKNLEFDSKTMESKKKESELKLKVVERKISKAEAMLQTFNSEAGLAKIKSIVRSEKNQIMKSENLDDLIYTALSALISVFKAYPRFRKFLEPPPFPESYNPSLSEFMELVKELIYKMKGKILENAEHNITEKIMQERKQIMSSDFYESMLRPYFTKLFQSN